MTVQDTPPTDTLPHEPSTPGPIVPGTGMAADGIKGIVFDLDGTLYHMSWYFRPLLTLLLLPKALRLPMYMKIRKEYMGRDTESAAVLLSRLATTLAERCRSGNASEMQTWIRCRFYPAFERTMPMLRGSRPGLSTTLATLKGRGIRLGVLSDFSLVTERLKGLGIDPALFDHLASSEDAGCLKPCPRPLHTIARHWGLDEREILVVGDRADTDGEAAELAGMGFLRISDRRVPPHGAWRWPEVREQLLALPGPFATPQSPR